MMRARNPWWILGACTLAIVCSGGPINIFTFGVFLRPVTDGLHIERSVLGGALLWTNMVSALCVPLQGVLLDRFGARRVLLVGVVFFAAATAAQSFMTASVAGIYLLFVLRGLGSSAMAVPSFAFVVTRWFDRQRGLALGIALSGVGLGTAIIPPIVAYLIGAYGWRRRDRSHGLLRQPLFRAQILWQDHGHHVRHLRRLDRDRALHQHEVVRPLSLLPSRVRILRGDPGRRDHHLPAARPLSLPGAPPAPAARARRRGVGMSGGKPRSMHHG
jgi:hypothetical protein